MYEAGSHILFERFPLEVGPSESVVSTLSRRGSLWVTGAESGPPFAAKDLVSAVGQIAAAGYVPRSMLRISTGGLVTPTEIAQTLTAWIEPEETSVVDAADWSDDLSSAACAREELEGHYSDSLATMLSDRVIMIDNQLCAVIVYGELRAAVVFDHDDDPMYSEPWVTLRLHNGYGHSWHSRGLVAPGIECTLFDSDGQKQLSLERPRETRPDERLMDLLAWADSLLHYTPEHRGTRLMVDRSGRFTTSEDEYVDVSGGFDPALWAKRTVLPVLEDGTA